MTVNGHISSTGTEPCVQSAGTVPYNIIIHCLQGLQIYLLFSSHVAVLLLLFMYYAYSYTTFFLDPFTLSLFSLSLLFPSLTLNCSNAFHVHTYM